MEGFHLNSFHRAIGVYLSTAILPSPGQQCPQHVFHLEVSLPAQCRSLTTGKIQEQLLQMPVPHNSNQG